MNKFHDQIKNHPNASLMPDGWETFSNMWLQFPSAAQNLIDDLVIKGFLQPNMAKTLGFMWVPSALLRIDPSQNQARSSGLISENLKKLAQMFRVGDYKPLANYCPVVDIDSINNDDWFIWCGNHRCNSALEENYPAVLVQVVEVNEGEYEDMKNGTKELWNTHRILNRIQFGENSIEICNPRSPSTEEDIKQFVANEVVTQVTNNKTDFREKDIEEEAKKVVASLPNVNKAEREELEEKVVTELINSGITTETDKKTIPFREGILSLNPKKFTKYRDLLRKEDNMEVVSLALPSQTASVGADYFFRALVSMVTEGYWVQDDPNFTIPDLLMWVTNTKKKRMSHLNINTDRSDNLKNIIISGVHDVNNVNNMMKDFGWIDENDEVNETKVQKWIDNQILIAVQKYSEDTTGKSAKRKKIDGQEFSILNRTQTKKILNG